MRKRAVSAGPGDGAIRLTGALAAARRGQSSYTGRLLGDQAEARRALGYDCAMVRRELRGRDLGCYCATDSPCHADTLLEVANAEASE